MGEGTVDEGLARELVDRYREAYETRDVEQLMALFAPGAEVTYAGRPFRGHAAIRRLIEWDARTCPTARVADSGIGVVVDGRRVVWERVVHLAPDGIPIEERAATIFELDDAGLISRLRTYYDKLDVLHQIASGSPGLQGRVFRMLTGWLIREGSKGLDLERG